MFLSLSWSRGCLGVLLKSIPGLGRGLCISNKRQEMPLPSLVLGPHLLSIKDLGPG